jgi:outer membrane lipoprotein
MKKMFIICVILLGLLSCTPVLNRDVMEQGMRDVPFIRLREAPEVFKGKLFILGGLIVETRLLETGSQIEALHVNVDSLGYLRETAGTQGRFLALYPRSKGLLDPMVYRKGREVTIAGVFVEVRRGRIDEMNYEYPVFEIRDIYLWEEQNDYADYPYYDPFYYRSPSLYDPWGWYYPSPNRYPSPW